MKFCLKVLTVATACLAFGCNEESTKIINVETDQPQECEIDGQVQCDDECIDPNNDPKYCGADDRCKHYTTCDGSSQECRAGSCVPKNSEQPKACEREGLVSCGDICINPKTNKTYCGADDHCQNFTTCDELSQDCSNGTCVPKNTEQTKACENAGQVKCGDACIDPKSAPKYCGADENCEHYTACDESSQNCSNGTCVNKQFEQPKTCEIAGQVKCVDTCIDPKTDQKYCGADDKCDHYTTCNEFTEVCRGGTCVPKGTEEPQTCAIAGQVKCGDTCIDPKTSQKYCGADENCTHYTSCNESSQDCIGGTCVNKQVDQPQNCNSGQVKCGNTCIDPKTNKQYCGADANCTHYTTCGDRYICDSGNCEFDYSTVTADEPSFTTDDGISNGISFRIINKTGKNICFSGKFKPYIKKDNPYNAWKTDGTGSDTTQELECHITPPTHCNGGWPHWSVNDIKLAPDEYKEFSLTEFKKYNGNGSFVQTEIEPMEKYTNGQWYFVAEDAPGGPGIKLGFAAMEKDGKRSNSAYIIHVRTIKPSDCKVEKGKKYNLIIYKADTDSKYWYCD